ncbi:phosphoglycerate mutase [Planoprotostelium fungivorum]|uniref:phosphoglycerate mutase (2,3-diphosphoglycerate-dependent) n=1 Tax=Planoprotostelium fungivorum TaxID=1890364 RepID=A0A2P6NVB3_9EUKA|nr:phosphoglycerate mutase [Planoprotostelium fungivorum]
MLALTFTQNVQDRFTGWQDIPLAGEGIIASQRAAKLLRSQGYTFDCAYSSALIRSIKTMHIILEEMGLEHIPEVKTWKLNERMYGQLQGMNKSEAKKHFGEAQIQEWRRSYDVPPPPVTIDDERWPGHFDKYKKMMKKEEIPRSECLKDIVNRTISLWREELEPLIRRGNRLLVVAHGSNIRAFMHIVCGMSEEECSVFESKNGVPLIIRLRRDDLHLMDYHFLETKSNL